jgi:hypothetical protein
VRLDEHARDPHRHRRARQVRHELPLAPADAPCPPGCCTLWVASNTTGQPISAMIGRLRMSLTSVL